MLYNKLRNCSYYMVTVMCLTMFVTYLTPYLKYFYFIFSFYQKLVYLYFGPTLPTIHFQRVHGNNATV